MQDRMGTAATLAATQIYSRSLLRPLLDRNAAMALSRIEKFDGGEYDPRQYREWASGIVDITPELAAWWLQNFANPRNGRHGRTLRHHQDKLLRSILTGQFEPTPDHIAFDVNGMLFNGHNRLTAISKSGRTVRQAVCFGFPSSACDKTDKGVSRTGGHTFMLRGIPNSNCAHGVCAAVYLHECGLPFENMAVNEHEALGVYDRDPERIDAIVRDARTVGSGCAIPPAVVGCMMYLCSSISADDSEQFFLSLGTGAGLELTSPILMLRRRMESARKRSEHLSRREMGALIAKAWNAYRTGRTIGLLRWNPDEAFPVLQ